MPPLQYRAARQGRRGSLLGLVLLTGLATALTGARSALWPTAASAGASAARVCSAPQYPGVGYFTSLQVAGVSCATGSRLAIAFYRCRLHTAGVKGRCHSQVLAFRCTERRNAIPTEIDARVTCRRGHQKVVHTYQQTT